METTIRRSLDEPWFRYIGWFWLVIIAGLFLFGAIQTVMDQPSVLHTGNGLVTALLVLADGSWFLYMMRLRRRRRFARGARSDRRLAFALVGLGIVLIAPLVLLHREFVALAFADIGIIAFVIGGWAGLVPAAFLGALFLYVDGVFSSTTAPQAGSDVLSLVSTIAITYSLSALVRQRTERDQLIIELREAHDQLRLSSARDVELAALRERNRLARDMHDSLGHALVLIAIKIEAAQRLQTIDPERAAGEWEATKALVRSTMSDLRNSLAGLRLPALDEQSFHTALAELTSELEGRAGVAVTVHAPREADGIDRDVQEALYRVAKEALANVAKHAHAQQAWLSLALEDGTARLVIEDDGVGLGVASRSDEAHYGVVGMRERVEGLGGVFTLGPRPEGGTQLRASVPLRERADARYPHPVG